MLRRPGAELKSCIVLSMENNPMSKYLQQDTIFMGFVVSDDVTKEGISLEVFVEGNALTIRRNSKDNISSSALKFWIVLVKRLFQHKKPSYFGRCQTRFNLHLFQFQLPPFGKNKTIKARVSKARFYFYRPSPKIENVHCLLSQEPTIWLNEWLCLIFHDTKQHGLSNLQLRSVFTKEKQIPYTHEHLD